MKIDDIKTLNTIVCFFMVNSGAYFKYNNFLYRCNEFNIQSVFKNIALPYKIKFIGISRANIGRILSTINEENNEIFTYRTRNDKNNLLCYEAVICEKQKIKK